MRKHATNAPISGVRHGQGKVKRDGLVDTDELNAFDAVATSRSFSRAAALLGCSQSAISQRIARLERRLGREIIRRTTRRVDLTADGEAMLIYARSILALAKDARDLLERPEPEGVLKVGIEDEFATTRLPLALSIFRSEFPNFGMKFVTGRNEHLLDALRTEDVDLILGKAHGDAEGEVLWHEPLVWAGHPATRISTQEPVPLITYTSPSITRTIAEEALMTAGRRWTNVVEGSNLLGLLAAAEAGLGVMAIGRSFRTSVIAALPAEADLPPLGTLSYVLETRPGGSTEAANAFCTVLRHAARQVAGDAPPPGGAGD